ncbi:MAG TPA: ABC transporter permease [Bacillota bacterium]|nr:ABC transporter permease [Bacillota bacterium]
MLDAEKLFKQRLNNHLKQLSRYLRYIFNGHIAVAMIFFVSAMAVFYQEWLAMLPKDFPASIVIGFLFGLIASYNPVRTLLKKPDLMFLIAAEHQLYPYFRRTLTYSFLTQIYVVFLLAAVLGPLYFHVFANRSGKIYLLTIIALLIVKGWNLIANWWVLKVRQVNFYRLHLFVRFLLNVSIFIFLIEQQIVLTTVMTFLLVGLFLYTYYIQKKFVGIPWSELVELEERHLQSFYRLANMFTDVPDINVPLKKRKWFAYIVQQFVPFKKSFTFDYLYRLTFIRSGDYLGMYVRLLVIGSLAIYFVDHLWLKIAFIVLFLYMSCFQLITLYRHHRTIMWLDLYPVSFKNRERSFLRLLYELTFFKTFIFALVFLWTVGDLLYFLLALGAGSLFVFLFMNGYVKRKIVQYE